MAAPRRLAAAALATASLLPLLAAAPAGAAATEPFLSEYVEGTSNNKALEITNPTVAPVDLAAGGYAVRMYFNGGAAAGLTVNLTGTVAPGDVFVLAHSSANTAILAQADQTNGAGWFNGDDAVVLVRGATVVDSIGQVGFDPGTEWGSGLTSTADNTLRRRIGAGPDAVTADAFPAPGWDGFATDTFEGLGHPGAGTGTPPPVLSIGAVQGQTTDARTAPPTPRLTPARRSGSAGWSTRSPSPDRVSGASSCRTRRSPPTATGSPPTASRLYGHLHVAHRRLRAPGGRRRGAFGPGERVLQPHPGLSRPMHAGGEWQCGGRRRGDGRPAMPRNALR